jgi:hypothetical protein
MESRAPVLIRRHLHIAVKNYVQDKYSRLRDSPSSYADAERLD